MPALLSTALPNLRKFREGKVREVYDLDDRLLIVATDRISAFDVVMANGIPDKGRVLNQMSAFWFDRFASVCRNHCVSVDDRDVAREVPGLPEGFSGRCMIARKARPLPIECVARGYIAGSLFKEYVSQGPTAHGLSLPEGLRESARLPEPIFTPASKAESGHDENLSFEQAADRVGVEVAESVRRLTLQIFAKASSDALERGIILADTKFEFGLDDVGLIWIDEALTPDSSRFWEASGYVPGSAQPSFDKQFVRDYLESVGFDKRPPGPRLPEDVVLRTRQKYIEAFEKLTGRALAGIGSGN